jgi:hypothetical protein
MKITFRTLAAIAVGTMILVSAAADAGTRPGIGPGPGASGQRSWMLAFARRMLPRTSAAALLSPYRPLRTCRMR